MAEYPIVPTAGVASKFLALTERARENLADLYYSGWWKQYYSERDLVAHARELNRLRDIWAAVAQLGSNGLEALQRADAYSPDVGLPDAIKYPATVQAIDLYVVD
jgi:hypothetical protein